MQQLQLNFELGEKMRLAREASLPKMRVDGSTVSAASVKAVLWSVFLHGRECFASQATLSSETGLSERVVRRALRALESLSLLAVVRRRRSDGLSVNHYRIVWSELALRQPDRSAATSAAGAASAPPSCPPVAAQELAATSAAVVTSTTTDAVASTALPTGATSAPDQPAYPNDQSAYPNDQSAYCDGPTGHGVRPSGRGRPPKSKEDQVKPPPPYPPRPLERNKPPPVTWAAAAASLDSVLDLGEKFLREAQAAGRSPDEVCRAIDVYQANRGKFRSSGALFAWLRYGKFPIATADLVEPEVAAERLERREQRRRSQVSENENSAAEQRAWRAVYQRLEQTLGPRLDALEQADRRELAERVLNDFERSHWARRPHDSGIRFKLLRALEESE